MKALVVLFSTLICLSSFGQRFPMVQDGATWITNAWSNDPPIERDLKIFSFISGDTLVDSLSYKKLYSGWDISDTVPSKNKLEAIIREDSLKVYVVIVADTEFTQYDYRWYCARQDTFREVLLYDFGLKVGDSIFHVIDGIINHTPRKVLSIDSILVGGQYRKRIELLGGYGGNASGYWIEGIGSTFGPFDPICTHYRSGSDLKCYWNNEVYFRTHTSIDCRYVGTEEFKDEDEPIHVFPNPSTGLIKIQLNRLCPDVQVILRDLKGRIIIDSYIKNQQNIELELEGPPGLYFVSVSSEGGQIGMFKVIKN